MRAKSFFYTCAGIFLLVLSYHLGARSAMATEPTWIGFSANHDGSLIGLSSDNRVYVTTLDRMMKGEPAEKVGSLFMRTER